MELGISLDQLRILAIVVEEGSFSAAARRMNRSQSAITYAVQKMEAAVGVPLFDRTGYRPELTEAGSALLPRARRVVEASAVFDRQALALRDGIEPELVLVVDAMFPMTALFAVLSEFDRRFPTVQTRLYVESLGATVRTLLDGQADLGIILEMANVSDGLSACALEAIELVPVASPDHPLGRVKAPLGDDDLRDHLQLVLTDRSDLTKGHDNGVLSVRTWRLADLGAKHAMLLAAMGWGTMPFHMVEGDLQSGRLVELELERWPKQLRRPTIATAIAHRLDRPPGPAGAWFFRQMAGLDPR
ncbi:LysR family transcriptional regulator [Paracoccus aminophilus]|uniref:Transcriptional regulator, LysR family n=1 Tax=Paracoccus aminophilus JCM 7686 TaxID=1367847 RepID=S5XUR4_PARAH|nr:LysR family transcriptional regulator [Paracoccus aminophilus]AGT11249.1 transcriptional regulator, LysR family [Paracoccus aminophilus JCM 7686]